MCLLNNEYGGTVSAIFYPYQQPDDLDIIVGGEVVATSGVVGFDGPNAMNESVTVSSDPISPPIPRRIFFRVNNKYRNADNR